jgi:hypothetical protein
MTATNGPGNTVDPAEIITQASRAMEAALKAAVKLQQESANWLTEMFNDYGSPQKWQNKTCSIVDEAVAVTQKNLDEIVGVMNQNAKTSVELYEKAMKMRQQTAPADAQAAAHEWWESALGALRTNTQAMMQANSRIFESWGQMTKKFGGRAAEIMETAAREAEELASKPVEAAEAAAASNS